MTQEPTAGEALEPNALPIDLAPRDGTILRLRVRYEPQSEKEWTPLEDAEESWTIGFNSLDNTGEDRWQVVGWDWSQDCLLEAVDAEVLGWLPFHGETVPRRAPAPVAAEGVDLHAIAKAASERVHKNGGCVPQLAFAPILWALQDALSPKTGEAQ